MRNNRKIEDNKKKHLQMINLSSFGALGYRFCGIKMSDKEKGINGEEQYEKIKNNRRFC